MKFILLAACTLGVAVCAPPQLFMEFDIRHAPAEAAHAIPAGATVGTLEVLLPVDAQRRPIGGPVRGLIKQEILEPNGRDTKDVYYPFGFDCLPVPAPAAPVAPVAPAAPAAPVAPVVPVVPIVAASAPAVRPSGDDDDDDDDDD